MVQGAILGGDQPLSQWPGRQANLPPFISPAKRKLDAEINLLEPSISDLGDPLPGGKDDQTTLLQRKLIEAQSYGIELLQPSGAGRQLNDAVNLLLEDIAPGLSSSQTQEEDNGDDSEDNVTKPGGERIVQPTTRTKGLNAYLPRGRKRAVKSIRSKASYGNSARLTKHTHSSASISVPRNTATRFNSSTILSTVRPRHGQVTSSRLSPRSHGQCTDNELPPQPAYEYPLLNFPPIPDLERGSTFMSGIKTPRQRLAQQQFTIYEDKDDSIEQLARTQRPNAYFDKHEFEQENLPVESEEPVRPRTPTTPHRRSASRALRPKHYMASWDANKPIASLSTRFPVRPSPIR